MRPAVVWHCSRGRSRRAHSLLLLGRVVRLGRHGWCELPFPLLSAGVTQRAGKWLSLRAGPPPGGGRAARTVRRRQPSSAHPEPSAVRTPAPQLTHDMHAFHARKRPEASYPWRVYPSVPHPPDPPPTVSSFGLRVARVTKHQYTESGVCECERWVHSPLEDTNDASTRPRTRGIAQHCAGAHGSTRIISPFEEPSPAANARRATTTQWCEKIQRARQDPMGED